MAACVVLGIAGYIDYKRRSIPDSIILILYVFAVFLSRATIIERIAGFFIPALPLFFLALTNKNIKGGDIKYFSAVGAYFGLSTLACLLLPATLAAVAWSALRREKSVPLAAVTAIGCAMYYVVLFLLEA